MSNSRQRALRVLLLDHRLRARFRAVAEEQRNAERLCEGEAGFVVPYFGPGPRLVLIPSADGGPELRAAYGFGVLDERLAYAADTMMGAMAPSRHERHDQVSTGDGARHVDRVSGLEARYAASGCLGTSVLDAYGSFEAYDHIEFLLPVHRTRAAQELDGDRRWPAAEQRASACIQAAVPGASTLSGLKRLAEQRYAAEGETDEAIAYERELAELGRRCGEEAGVPDLVAEVYGTYVAELPDEDIAKLARAYDYLMAD